MIIRKADKNRRRIFHFDIREILCNFFDKESPEAQIFYIKQKIRELIIVEGNKNLGPINKVKCRYLLKWRNLGFVLNGLLYQAEKEQEC
ncbi:MAG: hypothetical protein KAW12_10105 [Candidatus Aminicenantes bacterium]|nr:hypothetical protein [Candidatus Aminicenantes bacterium]